MTVIHNCGCSDRSWLIFAWEASKFSNLYAQLRRSASTRKHSCACESFVFNGQSCSLELRLRTTLKRENFQLFSATGYMGTCAWLWKDWKLSIWWYSKACFLITSIFPDLQLLGYYKSTTHRCFRTALFSSRCTDNLAFNFDLWMIYN